MIIPLEEKRGNKKKKIKEIYFHVGSIKKIDKQLLLLGHHLIRLNNGPTFDVGIKCNMHGCEELGYYLLSFHTCHLYIKQAHILMGLITSSAKYM